MKVSKSFLLFFYLLDQCYDICKEDDLGGFLGAISPELLFDGIPADLAILADWEEFNHSISIDDENIIQRAYDFLNSYESQFGFNFYKTKNLLLSPKASFILKSAIMQADKELLGGARE